MTLYLARKLVDGVVDETATVYLGRCDEDGCRYLADHADEQVVDDALEGHRARAHTTGLKNRPEDATRTGWLSVTGPIAAVPGSETTIERPPSWTTQTPAAWDPGPEGRPPSPTPRGEEGQ